MEGGREGGKFGCCRVVKDHPSGKFEGKEWVLIISRRGGDYSGVVDQIGLELKEKDAE